MYLTASSVVMISPVSSALLVKYKLCLMHRRPMIIAKDSGSYPCMARALVLEQILRSGRLFSAVQIIPVHRLKRAEASVVHNMLLKRGVVNLQR
jgi:hypothetical protein